MADMGQLVVQLELQQAQFTKGMNDAAKRLERLGSEAKKSQAGLNGLAQGFAAIQKAAAAAAAGFAAFRGFEAIVKAGDAIRNLHGSFTALLGSESRAADMLTRIFGIVERTGAPLEAVSGATQRLTIALKELGASNNQIATIAETFIKLGKVGGSSTAETAAGLQQLGQALASGKLGGDELKSIRENVPLVAQAIAQALGVTTGKLKELGEEGKLTADVVANALLKASTDAAAAFTKLPQSYEQALNRMDAQNTQFLASFDKASNLSKTLVVVLDEVTAALKRWTAELNNADGKMTGLGLAAKGLDVAFRTLAGVIAAMNFQLELSIRSVATLILLAGDVTSGFKNVPAIMADFGRQTGLALGNLIEFEKRMLNIAAAAGQASAYGKVLGDQETGGFPLVAPKKIQPGKAIPGGGGKGEDKAAKELEQLKERAKAIAASLVPAEQYNQTMAELDKLMAKQLLTQEVYNLAKGKAIETRHAERDAVLATIDPMFTYQRELAKIISLQKENELSTEQAGKAMDRLKEKLDDDLGIKKMKSMNDMAKELGDTIGTSLGDAFGDIIKGAATAEEAFTKMAQTVLSLIAKMAAEAAAAWIIKSLFGGATGGLTANPDLGRSASASLARVAANTNLATFGGPQARTGSGATTSGGNTIGGNQTRPELKVNVYNNAGVDVSTQQNAAGDLDITIDRVRKALSNDVRRGGNIFSDSLERSFTFARRGA